MKKYIGILFVLSLLVVPAFSFAQVGDVDPNPASDCVALQNNLRYRDRDVNKNGEVSTLQDFLQSQGYLNSEPTGYFGLMTQKAVKDFQKSNGISPTGYVGTITRAKIKVLTCDGGVINPPISNLKTYQANGFSFQYDSSATVELKTDESGAGTYYGVYKTGEVFESIRLINGAVESYNCEKPNVIVIKEKKFLYCDSKGEPARTYWYKKNDKTLIINVQGSNGKSYSYIIPESVEINSSVPTTPSITVFSPNGGEVYKPGQQVRVSWKTNPNKEGNNIWISLHGATEYVDLVTKHTANDGDEIVTIPSNIKSGSYKMTVAIFGVLPNTDTGAIESDSRPFTITSSTTGSPTISGISGPQSLNVGQEGTWTVTANDPNGGNLSYSVVWGDEGYLSPSSTTQTTQSLQQTATFTHSYSQAGMYTPTFTVTNTSGQSAKTSLSVNVGGVISPSASVTVLSPNGGETWIKGTTQTIKWQDNTTSTCPSGAICDPAPKQFDINLLHFQDADIYPIAKNISDYGSSRSFSWEVGQAGNTEAGFVPDGSYRIQICASGAEIPQCDFSDSYFKITSSIATNAKPIMGSISTLPPSIQIGQSVNFNFNATDPDNDDLYWSTDWGDGGAAGACPITNSQQKQGWTYNTNHTWNTAGTYIVKISVSDCRGGTADTSFSVNVGNTSTSSITVLSPNSGQVYQSGGTMYVSWNGGYGTDRIVIDLLQVSGNSYLPVSGSSRVTINNVGNYSLTIPSVPSASNYVIGVGILNASSGIMTAYGYSGTFTITSLIIGSIPKSALSANVLSALGSTITNTSSACAEFTMTLSKGMNNSEVKCLQKMLMEKGFKIKGIQAGEETTYFGYNTLVALKAFQVKNQLTSDGIFGLASREALKK
ncbi:MAG: peptidoglycan-binding protein [Candidatus Paceibacterota bacterium]